MPDDAGVPPSLEDRPKSATGLPVPYVNATRPDGSPDFTLVDAGRSLTAAHERRCALCAQPLGYWIAFLGGPLSLRDRSFLDGPSHEDCLVAATRLCPFLSRRTSRRSDPSGRKGIEPAGFEAGKPEEFFIGITRSYTTRIVPPGAVVHRAAPFKRIRRFHYVSDALIEDLTWRD